MSHTPLDGHPQGWDHKLADRSSLPPASGAEKNKKQVKHVFAHPHQYLPKDSTLVREETEGSSCNSPSCDPPYMRWARTIHDLLEDDEGVRLFREFVSEAGGLHLDRLNFYLAVRGLRQAENTKIRQVFYAICKFIQKSQLVMPEQLKTQVKSLLKEDGPISRNIFDAMEAEVTCAIADTTYRAFLRSDEYVAYVRANSRPLASPDDMTNLPPHVAPALPIVPAILPTLHEDEELSPSTRLTHDALMATQARRLHSEVTPAYRCSRSAYSHAVYAAYCPSSRVDSERASLSSGRADSEVISHSGSSRDGMSVRGVRERASMRQSGVGGHVINRDFDGTVVIPRTIRMQADQYHALSPPEFAKILTEKLERVKRDQDKERLLRRLAESENDETLGGLSPAVIAAAIREKLQLDDDNDQDILDQHVSRVWSERTPTESPPARRPRARRRPPSLSALSADSGHFDDPHAAMHHHRRSLSKKTVTELTDSGVSLVSESTVPANKVLMWMEAAHRTHEQFTRIGSAPSRPSVSSAPAQGASGDCTVVVVTFLDEDVPYRIRIPAAPLTLRTFKEYLPRKGNYKYFFKTECADLDNTVIQVEVSNDNDLLPTYEGKVMARVKSVE